jgi:hypothetical protein
MDDVIIGLAKNERPRRDWVKSETNRALKLYYGGPLLEDLIRKFSTGEEADKYAWRQQITLENYRNIVREVVRKYLEAITRAGKIVRKSGVTLVDSYLSDRYAKWFWREVAPFLLILPEMWVQVSMPPAQGESIQSRIRSIFKVGHTPPVISRARFIATL